MNTIRMLFKTALMIAVLAVAAGAQISSTTVTGTFYKADGVTPNPNAVVTLFEVQQSGAVISRGPFPPIRANSNGVVSFVVRRNSIVKLYADAPGFNDSNSGTYYVIPDAPTASLESLQRWVTGNYYVTTSTGDGLSITAPALSTGKALTITTPASGFTGYFLYFKDTSGVRKFSVDYAGTVYATGIDAAKLQGRDIATTAPTDGQGLVWSVANTRWQPGSVAASITVEEADGAPSLVGSTTVRFDQADGFVVSNPSGSIARVDLANVPYAALNLTGAILNADLAGSIAASKLVQTDIVLAESQVTNLVSDLAGKQASLGFTAENTANRRTTFQVTPDDTHYASEKLVKDSLDAKQASLGFTPENTANRRTSFQVTPDDTHYASEKLVKDSLDAKQASLGFTAVPDTRTVNGHALSGNVTVTSTDLGLVIGTNVQAFSARLSEVATIGTSLQQIRVNSGATALEYFTPSASATGANPTASVGLTAVNGSASTFLRSDGAPALDQGIVPTWTGIHTWGSGLARMTSPRVTTGILDANGNSMLAFSPTASAVDGFTFTNAATANPATVTMAATGSDSNVHLALVPKGTGQLLLNAAGTAGIAVDAGPIVRISDGGTGTRNLVMRSGTFMNGTNTTLYADSADAADKGFRMASVAAIAWTASTTDAGTTIVGKLRTTGTAGYAFGLADGASPVAQTLSVQNGTGTNTNGASSFAIIGSLGTSTGVPGRVTIKTGALDPTSGTTAHTAVERLVIGATKVLANNTTTTVVNVTDASNTVASGLVTYTVECFDGTDLQVETGEFVYTVSNKGGTIANNTITSATGWPKNVTTSGTLTVTWAISAANPALLSVNANSSLTPSSGYPRITYTVRNNTQQAIAVQ